MTRVQRGIVTAAAVVFLALAALFVVGLVMNARQEDTARKEKMHHDQVLTGCYEQARLEIPKHRAGWDYEAFVRQCALNVGVTP